MNSSKVMGTFLEVFNFHQLFLNSAGSFATSSWFSPFIAWHAHNYNNMLRTVTYSVELYGDYPISVCYYPELHSAMTSYSKVQFLLTKAH